MDKEKEIITETAINMEAKSDQQHNGENLIVTKSDHPTQPHNGKKIDKIIVPQYIDDHVEDNNYVVTYSNYDEGHDNSILGWTINIEENGQQHPDVYFKLDKYYHIYSFKLCKKTLLLCDFRHRKYLF